MSRDDYFVKVYSWLLDKLFAYVKPKCVIVNCASYGHNMAVVTYIAKKRGIKVIEPQHGVTWKGPAYNASDQIAESSVFAECLPDALFTFGNFWGECVCWKYEKYVVGSPYLNEYASIRKENNTGYDFLVISQPMAGNIGDAKNNFVRELARHFPGKKILFRIHPSEDFEEQKNIFKEENITISNSTTVLYDDFNNSNYILGWYSNCLYEALAFGKNPIIVDTPRTRELMAQNVGIWIKNPSEITEEKLQRQCQVDYKQFWAGDFEGRVKKYIDNIL